MDANSILIPVSPITSTHPQAPPIQPLARNSHDAAPSPSNASSTETQHVVLRKKRLGRPANARRLLEQPSITRRLIRLYLYTAESTLSVCQISQLLSAMAESSYKSRRLSASNGSKLVAKKRSTQARLGELFSENYKEYRNLRPRNREEARQRIKNLRLVRHGRVSKRRAHTDPCNRDNRNRPSSCQQRCLIPSLTTFTSDEHDAALDEAIDSTQPVSSSHDGEYSPQLVEANRISEHRLSWIRRTWASVSDGRPTSSFLLELRSLLSSRSSRWTLDSADNNILAALRTDDVAATLQTYTNGAESAENTALIKLCCGNSLKRPGGCLHRRFLIAALGGSGFDPGSVFEKVCFTTIDQSRDVWNQTLLHLAAKWAPDDTAISMVLEIIGIMESINNEHRLPLREHVRNKLNVKHVQWESFMHILARRWCDLIMPTNMTLASFCSRVDDKGYLFNLRDGNGRSFFDCFLASLESLHGTDAQKLRARSSLLSLSELSSDKFHRITNYALGVLGNYPLGLYYFYSELSYLRLNCYLPPIAEIVAATTSDPENEFHALLRTGRLESTHFQHSLCESWNDVSAYNTDGKTPVMVLIEDFDLYPKPQALDLLDAFIKHGSDLRLVDWEGNTALHYAVKAQQPQVVERLILAGVDLHAKNLRGHSALRSAF
ncbi:ankyrin [Xylaria digitata]|nr:ankyrin [Xylaria digitata]